MNTIVKVEYIEQLRNRAKLYLFLNIILFVAGAVGWVLWINLSQFVAGQ